MQKWTDSHKTSQEQYAHEAGCTQTRRVGALSLIMSSLGWLLQQWCVLQLRLSVELHTHWYKSFFMINPQTWNYTPVKNTCDKGCYEFHIVFDWLGMILIEHENTARGTADKTRQQCNINTLLFMSKLCPFSLYFLLFLKTVTCMVDGSIQWTCWG